MNAMNAVILRLARFLMARTSLPGRYVLCDTLVQALGYNKYLIDGYIGNYLLPFDLSDEIQRQMFFGIYDPIETQLIYQLLHTDDVFVDIGANVGYYTLLSSQIVGTNGLVHAFEPVERNIQILRHFLALNRVSNTTLNQMAVSKAGGTLQLYIGGDTEESRAWSSEIHGWASKVPSERRPTKLDVPTISMDVYLKEQAITHVSFLKMDIEGGEPDALQGMPNLLSRTDAPHILCEVSHYLLNKQGLDSRAITCCLADYGYTIYRTAMAGNLLQRAVARQTKVLLHAVNPDHIIKDTTLNLLCVKDTRCLPPDMLPA